MAVVMGGLTAKVPGGSVACLKFPQCGVNPAVDMSAVHVQLTHRVIAMLLILHLFGMLMAQRRKMMPSVVRRAIVIAFSLGVFQLLIAGAMIGMRLPPVLRSLHEATGVSVWIACFVLAYLARISSGGAAIGARVDENVTPLVDAEAPETAVAARRGSRSPQSVAVIVARGAES
ncbi:MAG: hypothetical protein ACJ756_12570 [Solirubrobacterales bacterium]